MKKNSNKSSAAEADAAYRIAKRRVVQDMSGTPLSFEPSPPQSKRSKRADADAKAALHYSPSQRNKRGVSFDAPPRNRHGITPDAPKSKRRRLPEAVPDLASLALVTVNEHAVKRPAARVLTSIRIIGGSLRNSKIIVPDQPDVRPTPDRVRETLFNWLTPLLPGARVLDLFAGTGALGIEALSRGAAFAEFVESDPGLCSKLGAELTRLKVADRARVTRAAVPGANALAHTPVEIIFLDPPFSSDLWLPSLAAIARSGVLKAGGVLYLEAPVALTLSADWLQLKHSKAGAVHFGLYRYQRALPDQPQPLPETGAA